MGFISSLFGYVLNFLYEVINNYGLAIILFTVLLKLILLPITIKQQKTMQKSAEMQEEMKKIQFKYKNNPEKMNEEVMKLYKEYNVNPMAGCLPLLIQMPILIGLFGALRQYDFDPIEHATFFWIPNLADKDPFYILPVLVAATMFLQQKISMAATPQAAENPTMKTMLYIMPAMMLFVCWSMPSGLCLYWAFFSILSIIQQFFMNKQKRKEMEARAAREAEEKEKRIAEKKAKMTSKKAAAGKGKQKEAVKADVVEEKEEE